MNLSHALISNIEKVFLGKSEAVKLAVSCLLAEGHLLIEDIPGVGKTTLALSLAKSIGASFQRIQFTSDLLPSDILGVSVFNPKSQSFEFKPGPLFHNIVLADEINRASPKTQSALLECMQEGQISVDGRTYVLPKPFFVIATQNPHEHHGVFPLPESQLDRFMMRLSLGYPETEQEVAILKGHSRVDPLSVLNSVAQDKAVLAEFEKIHSVRVDDSLDRYIIEIAKATRSSPLIDLGLSPRGTIALRRTSQAYATTEERDYVIPDDIKHTAAAVMTHRLRLKGGSLNGQSAQVADTVVKELVERVPVPV